MASMTRREAREVVFSLLFEADFQKERQAAEILAGAREDREIGEDDYVTAAFLGTTEKLTTLDALIGKFSNGWKPERLSYVSRAVLRLATYEMLFCDDIPTNVTLNEAVELIKKFDDPKARAFVNGVLNGIKNEIEAKGASDVIAALAVAGGESDGQ